MLVPFLRGMARNGEVVHLKDEFQDRRVVRPRVKGCEKLGMMVWGCWVLHWRSETQPIWDGNSALWLHFFTEETQTRCCRQTSRRLAPLPPSPADRIAAPYAIHPNGDKHNPHSPKSKAVGNALCHGVTQGPWHKVVNLACEYEGKGVLWNISKAQTGPTNDAGVRQRVTI